MALLASRFSNMHCHLADQHACTPYRLLKPTPRHPKRSSLRATPSNSNGGGSSSSSGRLAPPNKDSTISPARLLHSLEFTAIAVAAVGHAAILVSSAVSQWRQTQQIAELQDQLSIGAEAAASTRQYQRQQHAGTGTQQQLLQQEPAGWLSGPPRLHLHSGLHLITGSALVVGLLCGAGLRQLQLR